jgi:hypothetical protein
MLAKDVNKKKDVMSENYDDVKFDNSKRVELVGKIDKLEKELLDLIKESVANQKVISQNIEVARWLAITKTDFEKSFICFRNSLFGAR